MLKSSFCPAFVRKCFKQPLNPMFVQTIVLYNHLVFCAEQHFECEYSNIIPKDVAGNSRAKLQTKQKFKKQKLISKAKTKISLGMPFFPNHPVSLNE